MNYNSLPWLLCHYTHKQPQCIDHHCGCSVSPLIAPGNLLAMVTTPNDHHCGNSCSRSNSWLVQLFHTETKGREGEEEEERAGGSLSSAVRQDVHLCLVNLLSIHPSIHSSFYPYFFFFSIRRSICLLPTSPSVGSSVPVCYCLVFNR